MKPAIDDIFIKQDHSMLKLIPLIVILLYAFKGLAMYGQDYLMNYVGEDIIRQLRNQLYDRIQDLSLAFFHREKTGTLMSRITNDVYIIKTMVSTSVTGSVRDVFSIIGLTGVILARGLALIGLFIIPAKRRQAKKDLKEKVAEMRETLVQSLRAQFEREIQRSIANIKEAIGPYSRFVRAEGNKLEGTRQALDDFQVNLGKLRGRIESPD